MTCGEAHGAKVACDERCQVEKERLEQERAEQEKARLEEERRRQQAELEEFERRTQAAGRKRRQRRDRGNDQQNPSFLRRFAVPVFVPALAVLLAVFTYWLFTH
jgi:NF-X1-type zinc finger protein NFXL1